MLRRLGTVTMRVRALVGAVHPRLRIVSLGARRRVLLPSRRGSLMRGPGRSVSRAAQAVIDDRVKQGRRRKAVAKDVESEDGDQLAAVLVTGHGPVRVPDR